MTGIQEYKGISDHALINGLFSSGNMLFGMQLNEILWVLGASISEMSLYGLITTPWLNKPFYTAEVRTEVSNYTEIALVGEPAAEVEEKTYDIMDFYVQSNKDIFKGIKVKSLSEARELPYFYMLDEEMIDNLVIKSFEALKPKIYMEDIMKSAQQRPKERTGKVVNFNQKEEKKDRMILI